MKAMMDRRNTILAILALGAMGGSPLASAQQAKTPRRIATLDDAHESSRARDWAAFRKRLQDLGYTEAKGYVIEGRWAKVQPDRLPPLAAELVALNPDVIVTVSTPAALAAMRATTRIPIVAVGATDPVKVGLVKSFARPEGNLTGIMMVQPDILGKWLELLREIAPKAKSLALLTNIGNPASMATYRDLQELAKPLGVAVKALDGSTRSNVERAFADIVRERMGALIVGASGTLLIQRQRIVEAAARLRIPALYARRQFVEAGGLMSYGADFDALFTRAADYVHRIEQGAKPSELPFEQTSVFRLVVNAKAAQALGLKIPESVRARVDEVIQ
jgi:putative ABC transport system substrate-binding protein